MRTLISFLLIGLLFSPQLRAAQGKHAMAVTSDPYATKAALEILKQGGNAVDAAIAAQWVLNVVEPQSSGIGGGGFFLYYDAVTKQIHAFDGREQAPQDAYPDMFLDENGFPFPYYPDRITGGLAVGVPGTLKLLQVVHSRFGSKKFSFSELFGPAIEVAERGFPVSKRLARYLEEHKKRLKLFPASRQTFFNPEGKSLEVHSLLFMPDLAETFKLVQKEGIRVFYEGEIAKDIAKAVREAPFHPGLMSEDDLSFYRVKERNPIRGRYRQYDVFSMGPPSSGGTTLIETLQILGFFDLAYYGKTADGIHLFSEAQKLAFQDRNHWLADPDYVEIPTEKIVSLEFAEERSQAIRWEYAIPTTQAAMSPLNLGASHTSHLSIVDEWGNMVSYTTTIESVFGSALMVPGRGFLLNNELTDFEAVPKDDKGKPVANAPEGGKRPMSSMTPTFIFREGKPLMIVGAAGGTKIIGAVLNILTNVLDFGMSLNDAMNAPRIINRYGPTEMETFLYENQTIVHDLERRGHPIRHEPSMGIAQAVWFDEDNHAVYGETDPRGEGSALGY
ncbi:MAG: gamma-glutamyltransferase [Candidatus Omnitrophica bacterium]|nr:gamma-glutamyltransferase [Candidatus Omnitrophota bacterium]